MKNIEERLSQTESEIKSNKVHIRFPIKTIPGIRPILGAVILGEIGDIKRFASLLVLVLMLPTLSQANTKALTIE